MVQVMISTSSTFNNGIITAAAKISLLVACLMMADIALSQQVTTTVPSKCSKGTIQLTVETSDIISCTASDTNSMYTTDLLPLCGAAFEVTVTSKGYMYLTPVGRSESYNAKISTPDDYFGNSGNPDGSNSTTAFSCAWYNATGTLDDTSTGTRGLLTFFSDLSVNSDGPSSLENVNGKDLNLQFTSLLGCLLTYKVVSGCVLGVSAPGKPAGCAKGTYTKKDKESGKSYCALCPPGTSSSGPGATSCTPCKPGTYNSIYGGVCTKCPSESYAPGNGTATCLACDAPLISDGITCRPCPRDSASNGRQCVACSKGVKCCRTNPSKDCPKCPDGFKSSKSTAKFALVSANSPRCLNSNIAACTAQMEVTIKKSCEVTFVTSMYAPTTGADCLGYSWAGYLDERNAEFAPTRKDKGVKQVIFSYNDYGWSMSSFKAPYLYAVTYLADFNADGSTNTTTLISSIDDTPSVLRATTPTSESPTTANFPIDGSTSTRCVLKYRALSGQAAVDLGVSPKPCPSGSRGCTSPTATCPAGSYVGKAVDATGAPCLPCPPGHFTSKASASTKCKPCPEGTFAPGFSSTKCSTCPTGLSSNEGSVTCASCNDLRNSDVTDGYAIKPGSKCQRCPPSTFSQPIDAPTLCMLNNYGDLCCVEGSCQGVPKCTDQALPRSETYTAVLKVVKTSLSAPECEMYGSLTCLPSNSLMAVTTYGDKPGVLLTPVDNPLCPDESYISSSSSSFEDYTNVKLTGPTTAEFTDDGLSTSYNITVHPSTRKMTMKASDADCSVELELVAGYVMGIKPPADAKCPPTSVPYTKGDRTFCKFCGKGQALKGKKCVDCRAGQYNNVFGSASGCKPCPAGQIAEARGSGFCTYCSLGQSSGVGAKSCKPCKPNTFVDIFSSPSTCQKCPSGLVSPKGSSFCHPPFPK